MNVGGTIQSASDSVEKLFGWTPSELFGRNLKMLIPEPRRSALDRYLDRYRHSIKGGAQTRTRCFDAIRKDGSVIQIELSVSRADLPDLGEPYFIGIVRDVSHEIDVGRQRSGDHLRLQQLVPEQTRALATANLRLHLADRMASLGTLAAGLGHDMNNVLLPVRARLNALESAGISGPALAHVKAVRRSIAYLQHLSDGLHFLAVDPEGSGSPEQGADSVALADWWAQVGDLLRKAVPAKVQIKVAIPARLPEVRIAPHWLTQAMLNIMVNAGEATQGVRRAVTIRISAAVADEGRMVKLVVADNGRGMSAAIQRRAFDIFYTTKPRGMGTGLGLPLVRKVALRVGGHVELQSTPGKGTTVTLSLPTVAHRASGKTSGKAHRQSAAISLRDPRAAALITQILISAGYDVHAQRGQTLGTAGLWVTDPTPKALAIARRWRGRTQRGGTIVLSSPPPPASRARWAALQATSIDPPNDFESMRHALHPAAVVTPKSRRRKGTP